MRKQLQLFTYLIIVAVLGSIAMAAAVSPGKTWEQFRTPEEAGWSSSMLKEIYDESDASAIMVVYRGKVVAALGDVTRRYKCHSVRKSLLSSLYGIHVDAGTINLEDTLEKLGIDDTTPLTENEKKARVRDLLKSRSGVYLPAGAETTQMKAARPKRGSHEPDTFFYYNNWDFNVLGTIFEQETKKDLVEEFYHRIAVPLGMEDFRVMDGSHEPEPQYSKHPSYPFKMSARDMARFGLLYLQSGKWNGKQIISEKWVRESTKPYSRFPEWNGGYGYLWWSRNVSGTKRMYYASGVGGQTIGVVPSEDVVIVLRADTYNGKSVKNLNRVVERLIEARKVKPKKNPVFIPLELKTPKKYRPLEGSKIKPETYTGTYHWDGKHTWNGDAVTIRQEKSQLILDNYHFTMRFRLLPISKKRFFVEDIERILDVRMGADGKPSAVMIHHTETTAGLYYTIMAKGIDAGIEEFQRVKSRIVSDAELRFLSDNLKRAKKETEALEVLKLNAFHFPYSLRSHQEFAGQHLKAYGVKSTYDIYSRILKSKRVRQKGMETRDERLNMVEWFYQWLKAKVKPMPVSAARQRRYVGNYDVRHVFSRNGDLYYYRNDPATETRLLKLTDNTFVLENKDYFRIRFQMGKGESADKAVKILGIYAQGHTDESVRDK